MSLYDKIYKSASPEDAYKGIEEYFKNSSSHCNDVIGSGGFGYVYVPHEKNIIKIPFGDENVEVSVVYKSKVWKPNIVTMFQLKNNIIYSSGYDMTLEAIVLIILSELWYNEITPHVNFVVAAYACSQSSGGNKYFVDKIIAEKCGLDNKIEYERPKSYIYPTLGTLTSTYLGTLNDFIIWLNCTNAKEFDFPEFHDYIFISLTHTFATIWQRYKINVLDMKSDNIFIQWIKEDTRLGKVKMNAYKKFSYKVDDYYLTFNNFGIIPKIGDVGVSVMNPYPNFQITSGLLEDNYEFYSQELYSYLQVADAIKRSLKNYHFKRTSLSKLLDSEPFNNLLGQPFLFVANKIPYASEILKTEYFLNYKTTSVPEDSFEVLH